MIDFVALVLLAVLLLRGWARGFVREGMDLVGLIVGTILAFRLAPLVGSGIAAVTGWSTQPARLLGGMIVLFGFGIGAAFVTRALEQRFRMPGLNFVNRMGGAGLAATWGVFLATLILTLGVVLPLPPGVADRLDESAVTRTLTDPDGTPQQLFNSLSGDRLIAAALNLRELVGTRRVIIGPGEVIEIAPASLDRLERDHAAAAEIFALVNQERAAAGVGMLQWNESLADVGYGHAVEMYVEGYFGHQSETTGDVGDRLEDAGVRYQLAGENLALAITPREVHQGLMDSPGHRANILTAGFTEIGIAVVSGPLGLMTVQVFTG